MAAGFVASRAAQIDDVAISVSVVHYSDGPAVVRVDLEQLALDGKTYVDLSVTDALWLQDAVRAATRDLGVDCGPEHVRRTRSLPNQPESTIDTAGRSVREVLLALGRGDDEALSAICRAYASQRGPLPGRVVLQLTLRRLPAATDGGSAAHAGVETARPDRGAFRR